MHDFLPFPRGLGSFAQKDEGFQPPDFSLVQPGLFGFGKGIKLYSPYNLTNAAREKGIQSVTRN